jgi:hypothetical protein
MQFFVAKFKWFMIISGLLTCTMFLGLFSPQSLLNSNFGAKLEGPLEEIIVRNWAALIGLMGIMLIYGAFVTTVRRFILIMVGISKVLFIVLVLSLGQQYLKFGVGTAVIVDSIMIVFFIAYLLLSGLHK